MLQAIALLLPLLAQQVVLPSQPQSTPQPSLALTPIRILLTNMMLTSYDCLRFMELLFEGACRFPTMEFSTLSHHYSTSPEFETQLVDSMDDSIWI